MISIVNNTILLIPQFYLYVVNINYTKEKYKEID